MLSQRTCKQTNTFEHTTRGLKLTPTTLNTKHVTYWQRNFVRRAANHYGVVRVDIMILKEHTERHLTQKCVFHNNTIKQYKSNVHQNSIALIGAFALPVLMYIQRHSQTDQS